MGDVDSNNQLPFNSWLPAINHSDTDDIFPRRSSRSILETIFEETSDEEDIHDVWPIFDNNLFSCEDESTVELEILEDQDTISERDYICPAKRRKQESLDFFLSDKSLTKNYMNAESADTHNFEKRLPFNDYGHDKNLELEISLTSISRTSSLTLFESLERQLQIESQQSDCSMQPICCIQSNYEKSKTDFLDDQNTSKIISSNNETKTLLSFGALNTSIFYLLNHNIADIDKINEKTLPYGTYESYSDKLNDSYDNDSIPYENIELTPKYASTSSIDLNSARQSKSSKYLDNNKLDYNVPINNKSRKTEVADENDKFNNQNEHSFVKISKEFSISTPNFNDKNSSHTIEQIISKERKTTNLFYTRKMKLKHKRNKHGSDDDFLLISSVPENLNLLEKETSAKTVNQECDTYEYFYAHNDYYSPKPTRNSFDNKIKKLKSNAYTRNWNKKTTSYANLTQLNYSDDSINIHDNMNEKGDLHGLQQDIIFKNDFGYFETTSENHLNQIVNETISEFAASDSKIQFANKLSNESTNKKLDSISRTNNLCNSNRNLIASVPNLNDYTNNHCNVTEISKRIEQEIHKSLIELPTNLSKEINNKFTNIPTTTEKMRKNCQKESQNAELLQLSKTLNNFSQIHKNKIIEHVTIDQSNLHASEHYQLKDTKNSLKNNSIDRCFNTFCKQDFMDDQNKSFTEKSLDSQFKKSQEKNLDVKNSNKTKRLMLEKSVRKSFLSRLSYGIRFPFNKNIRQDNNQLEVKKKRKKSCKQIFNNGAIPNNNKNGEIENCDGGQTLNENEVAGNGGKTDNRYINNSILTKINTNGMFNNLNIYKKALKKKSLVESYICKNENNFKNTKNCFSYGPRTMGLLETNLDTNETVVTVHRGKAFSLVDLGTTCEISEINDESIISYQNKFKKHKSRRPHKSMEYLLDKENHRCALPPENELQKSHDNNATLSEHQLRVQASLQKLNIPDWYKQYQSTNCGTEPFELNSVKKKKDSEIGRWQGLNNKTISLNSLGSHRSYKSPVMLSPSAYSHQSQPGFSRWSTLCLNTNNQISPSASTRSSFSKGFSNSSYSSYAAVPRTRPVFSKSSNTRQPYLGWRSQEKVSQPRTPAERLASTIELRKPTITSEIQTSISEVTSAIVHYVNDKTQQSKSRSVSPSSKVWLESSFVGTRLESPETPTIFTSPTISQRSSKNKMTKSTESSVNKVDKNAPILTLTSVPDRQTASAIQLEDVLASLLGLPSDSHSYTHFSSGMHL